LGTKLLSKRHGEGTVFWQEHEHPIDIFLTESKDALVGSGLMQGQKLAIDYADRTVIIEPAGVPKPGKPKKRRSAN
jgi:hypothetical protein